VSNPDLVILTNIRRIYENKAIFGHLSESFTKIFMPENSGELKKIFNKGKFVLSVINADKKIEDTLFEVFTKLVNKTKFPVLIIAGKRNIKKYDQLLPVVTDYLIKPAKSFEFHLRISRLMELYKMVHKLDLLKGFEDELEMRNNVLELSRQELISGAETIKALDTALDLSREEMLNQKEEIMALEHILEYSRMDKMDLMNHVKIMEEIIRLSSGEKTDYKKEIEALENLLLYIIREKKGITKKKK
jgi:hypothetical protein